jgi:hypothetical protein
MKTTTTMVMMMVMRNREERREERVNDKANQKVAGVEANQLTR